MHFYVLNILNKVDWLVEQGRVHFHEPTITLKQNTKPPHIMIIHVYFGYLVLSKVKEKERISTTNYIFLFAFLTIKNYFILYLLAVLSF